MVIAGFFKPTVPLAILMLAILPAFSETDTDDFDFILACNTIAKQETTHRHPLISPEVSESKYLCLEMIWAYQRLVSSQQENAKVCMFTPSCSHFGYSAIQQHGIAIGILMTSDRLQRCHGFSQQFYAFNPIAGKLSDPVESEYLFDSQPAVVRIKEPQCIGDCRFQSFKRSNTSVQKK
ncbi:MAG: membrane protein insertion efficiency factor YidD [Bacillota bacterium]|nr:membrane protein insertion efficiency factor YidD [Bacillota bacterium]